MNIVESARVVQSLKLSNAIIFALIILRNNFTQFEERFGVSYSRENTKPSTKQETIEHATSLDNVSRTFVLHENVVSPPWSFLVIEILVEFAGSTSLARLIGEQTIGHHPLVKFT